ncbi:MAG: hypothetical protein ACRD3J_21745, partial [Thermoanaerobaculia bacterium]
PSAIAIDSAGNLYVADTFSNVIRKVTAAGVVTTLAGTPGFFRTGSVDGAGAVARFNNPAGIAADGNGNLYVADWVNATIRKITPAGIVTTFAGSPSLPKTREGGRCCSVDGTGSAARFAGPYGVATDRLGNVYVTDTFNNTVRRITSAGVVSTVAGQAGVAGSNDGAAQ